MALGVFWRELARRAQRNNEGTELGRVLTRVADAITEDVATFGMIMDRLDLEKSTAKPLVATAAERVMRTKPNGRVRGYSRLSRFLELDILAMGIDGKKLLWSNIRDVANVAARLPDVDFDELIERAERQRAELEPFRAEAGREALASTPR